MIRIWAAVKDDRGIVRASIRDVPAGDYRLPTGYPEGAFERPWCVEAWDEHRRPGRLEKHGKSCGPGSPCAWCEKRALAWWVEWDNRRARQARQEASA